MMKILALASIAMTVPLIAIWNNIYTINVPALAEDDCAYYHDTFYVLKDVVPVRDDEGNGYVVCRYRADTFLF